MFVRKCDLEFANYLSQFGQLVLSAVWRGFRMKIWYLRRYLYIQMSQSKPQNDLRRWEFLLWSKQASVRSIWILDSACSDAIWHNCSSSTRCASTRIEECSKSKLVRRKCNFVKRRIDVLSTQSCWWRAVWSIFMRKKTKKKTYICVRMDKACGFLFCNWIYTEWDYLIFSERSRE